MLVTQNVSSPLPSPPVLAKSSLSNNVLPSFIVSKDYSDLNIQRHSCGQYLGALCRAGYRNWWSSHTSLILGLEDVLMMRSKWPTARTGRWTGTASTSGDTTAPTQHRVHWLTVTHVAVVAILLLIHVVDCVWPSRIVLIMERALWRSPSLEMGLKEGSKGVWVQEMFSGAHMNACQHRVLVLVCW